MIVRPARVSDAERICELVNEYAERGLMLHRSLESVYRSLRSFLVAEDDGRVVGCAAVEVFWGDLAEIRSLAVAPDRRGGGIGAALADAAIRDAARLGISRLFALTYESGFFERFGFEIIDRGLLPEKVWSVCLNCPKADACDEIAMIRRIEDEA